MDEKATGAEPAWLGPPSHRTPHSELRFAADVRTAGELVAERDSATTRSAQEAA